MPTPRAGSPTASGRRGCVLLAVPRPASRRPMWHRSPQRDGRVIGVTDVAHVHGPKRLGKPGGAQLPDRLADAEDWLSPYWPGLGGAAPKVRGGHELCPTVFA